MSCRWPSFAERMDMDSPSARIPPWGCRLSIQVSLECPLSKMSLFKHGFDFSFAIPGNQADAWDIKSAVLFGCTAIKVVLFLDYIPESSWDFCFFWTLRPLSWSAGCCGKHRVCMTNAQGGAKPPCWQQSTLLPRTGRSVLLTAFPLPLKIINYVTASSIK